MSNVLIGIIGVILFIGLALGNANFFDFRAADGTYIGDAAYAVAGMGWGTEGPLTSACRIINRQSGIAMVNDVPPTAPAPIGQQGCFFVSDAWGGLPNGLLVVYHAV